jgi:hypothetical protein
VRIRGDGGVTETLAQLVLGQERKEQVTEVHDVECPDDSDSRHEERHYRSDSHSLG